MRALLAVGAVVLSSATACDAEGGPQPSCEGVTPFDVADCGEGYVATCGDTVLVVGDGGACERSAPDGEWETLVCDPGGKTLCVMASGPEEAWGRCIPEPEGCD